MTWPKHPAESKLREVERKIDELASSLLQKGVEVEAGRHFEISREDLARLKMRAAQARRDAESRRGRMEE
jgi:hypothetical protein